MTTSNPSLAYVMRPRTIDEVIGQHQLLDDGKILNSMVKAKRLRSMILYGPPGTGKTSIAQALSGSTGIPFAYMNASVDNKKTLQSIAETTDLEHPKIMLLDEIHRLDKIKQDYLLPFLESGQLIVIGATTENPYISISPAIRSRSMILQVEPLTPDDIKLGIANTLKDKDRGLGNRDIHFEPEALDLLAKASDGDLRFALSILEIAVLSAGEDPIEITLSTIEELTRKHLIKGDKNGDVHYDVISAFQKSIRGSDVDAALHYGARIMASGDIQIITRRLMVIAYEDIGLANPAAAAHAIQAIDVALRVGFPEARIPLANAIIELTLSPKSNAAYTAINEAIKDVESKNYSIPVHLRDAHYKGAAKLGHGVDYKYAHDYNHDWVKQQYLPSELGTTSYLHLKGNSAFEISLKRQYEALKKANPN